MSRSRTIQTWSVAIASGLAFTFAVTLSDVVSAVGAVQVAAGGGGRQGHGGGGGGRQGGPRPYAEVITSTAKTDEGLFKVHRVQQGANDTLFYEIPKAELGKDMLWNTQIKRNAIGQGYGGQNMGSRVVRWVQRGDRILLLNIDYTLIADASNPLADAANYPAIIRSFPIATTSPSGDPVIDVTAMFTTNVPQEFSGGGRGGGVGRGDPIRTFLERAMSFPENIHF